jgi:hypothetical protein
MRTKFMHRASLFTALNLNMFHSPQLAAAGSFPTFDLAQDKLRRESRGANGGFLTPARPPRRTPSSHRAIGHGFPQICTD